MREKESSPPRPPSSSATKNPNCRGSGLDLVRASPGQPTAGHPATAFEAAMSCRALMVLSNMAAMNAAASG